MDIQNINVEVKILNPRLHEWGLPDYQSSGAGALDLIACVREVIELRPQETAMLIPTGIAVSMPSSDMAALVLPRSGLGHKKGLVLGNTVGLIDSDYQGEIAVSAWNRCPDGKPILIEPGMRVAQLMFVPIIRPRLSIVTTFSTASERGEGGFGSTGA